MAAVAGVRSNPTVRSFYLLRANRKHAKPALIASLVILNAMLHHKTH
jgi:hypothetical protein